VVSAVLPATAGWFIYFFSLFKLMEQMGSQEEGILTD